MGAVVKIVPPLPYGQYFGVYSPRDCNCRLAPLIRV